MVAAFLKAEISSSRWRESIHSRLERFGLTELILENPDVNDSVENSSRSALLGEFRGWRKGTLLFRGWPEDLAWSLARIGKEDLASIRYANAPEWAALSRDTFQVMVGANRIKGNDWTIPSSVPVGAIKSLARAVRAGQIFPPVIAIGSSTDPTLVMVEGQCTITGYAVAGAKAEIDALIGTGPRPGLLAWSFCPPLGT